MDNSDHKNLLRQIAEVETQIIHLQQQQEAAETTLGILRKQLERSDAETQIGQEVSDKTSAFTTAKISPEEKVALFARLFRGREDVYPSLWQNQKTGKKGYSPTCANEWIRGVCEKPRVKCGDCPNQAFLSVTADTVLDHLQGRRVIGVYPLLTDETCWFLAVDFDKATWQQDVLAFAETCQRLDLPFSIERSRSGNGAHVWFFFSSPVPAVTARKMGSYLITETMTRRHELSMASYDRLFPNQDTLPNGSFGNLIALPLQHHARPKGNTVFLDDGLESIPDQWGYLASLVPISIEKVNRIAMDASKRGQVIGLQIVANAEDHPWFVPPSRTLKHLPIAGSTHAMPGASYLNVFLSK